jgi:hypothetical protein
MDKLKSYFTDGFGLKPYFVILCLITIWLMLQNRTNTKRIDEFETQVKVLKSKTDSLEQEIFVKDIMIGQYEVMWGILEERNPKLALEIDNQVE